MNGFFQSQVLSSRRGKEYDGLIQSRPERDAHAMLQSITQAIDTAAVTI
jgi:hypothetical protein